ncbi:lipopolysaccharide assembly LapA domain-containing protein [Micromonospora sp. NBC_00858]|uniref:LapA family protein n=1 Tax=Micromonospora sp. NBC_00858 TaxID=2975979 RepID=UPI00386A2A2F
MTAPRNHSHPAPPVDGHDGTDAASWPTPDRPVAARSRMGGLWVAAVVFAFVLLLLLIFVLQNGQRAEVSFLGAHGHLPMGVALVLAAVFGILLVALPGTARIVQLRMLHGRTAGHPGARSMPVPLSSTAAGTARVTSPRTIARTDEPCPPPHNAPR